MLLVVKRTSNIYLMGMLNASFHPFHGQPQRLAISRVFWDIPRNRRAEWTAMVFNQEIDLSSLPPLPPSRTPTPESSDGQEGFTFLNASLLGSSDRAEGAEEHLEPSSPPQNQAQMHGDARNWVSSFRKDIASRPPQFFSRRVNDWEGSCGNNPAAQDGFSIEMPSHLLQSSLTKTHSAPPSGYREHVGQGQGISVLAFNSTSALHPALGRSFRDGNVLEKNPYAVNRRASSFDSFQPGDKTSLNRTSDHDFSNSIVRKQTNLDEDLTVTPPGPRFPNATRVVRILTQFLLGSLKLLLSLIKRAFAPLGDIILSLLILTTFVYFAISLLTYPTTVVTRAFSLPISVILPVVSWILPFRLPLGRSNSDTLWGGLSNHTSLPSFITRPWCLLGLEPCSPPDKPSAEQVAGIAKNVAEQAVQTKSLFDVVMDLEKAEGGTLGLHYVEIWELGIAVKATSTLPGRETLGEELVDFGKMTRDLRDALIRIQSVGINSFGFIVSEFVRIEKLISHLHKMSVSPNGFQPSSSTSSYMAADPSVTEPEKVLTNLYWRLDVDLTKLIGLIDHTIPMADRASDLGGRVLEDLEREGARLREMKENTPLWNRLVGDGWKGKQLLRDLNLTRRSVFNIRLTRRNLENARSILVRHGSNVAMFKSGLVGLHIAENGLSPELEMASLRHTIDDFRRSLAVAKSPASRMINIIPFTSKGSLDDEQLLELESANEKAFQEWESNEAKKEGERMW